MKKPIDPNLNSNENESLLFGKQEENIAPPYIIKEKQMVKDPHPNRIGKLEIENTPSAKVEKVKTSIGNLEENTDNEPQKNISETEEHHHHHHSSEGEHHHSGSHHHHSSGSHHSSSKSSSHRHSGKSHHSSSGSHHHHHHHSSHSKKKKKKIWLKVIIAIILIIALLISGIFGAYFISSSRGQSDIKSTIVADTDHEEIIEYNGHQYEFNRDVVSLAFIGVDQRTLVSSEDSNYVGCADADIVLAINTKTGSAKVIAIPRDTMVEVDQYGSTGEFLRTRKVQLCLSYAYGDGRELSCENVAKSISRVLYNVPIEKYFALDMDGISAINDSIGGVTLESMYDFPNHGIKKGDTVTLKGLAAEDYVHIRDMDHLTASLERSERQIQYVKAFASQVVPKVFKDFSIISDLYNTASKYSQTNITLNNATYLATIMVSKNITTFDSYSIKGTMGESPSTVYQDAVNAEFTPDEDSLLQTVLEVYYTQID